ncbi:MAG: aminoglycoside 3'-phosphotransferase [Gemmatimonadetes bacterium]|nr:aminoglycoside 3'-phosphotransferase [Gemmatimonadota bacterium]
MTLAADPGARVALDPALRIPEALRRTHAGWRWDLIHNEVPEVATWRLARPDGEARYLKLARPHGWPAVRDEAERTRWARTFLNVPEVLAAGRGSDVEWMLTRALPGRPATDPTWTARPQETVQRLARALRRFHEAPASACPFRFTLDDALAHARARLRSGAIVPGRDFHPEFAHLSAADALERLWRTRPATEAAVVCHGDFCLPNVVLTESGDAGFVDLGELGVADPWWDLAVATWSLDWNLGPGYETLFLDTYGAAPDPARRTFYRLLYDVVS